MSSAREESEESEECKQLQNRVQSMSEKAGLYDEQFNRLARDMNILSIKTELNTIYTNIYYLDQMGGLPIPNSPVQDSPTRTLVGLMEQIFVFIKDNSELYKEIADGKKSPETFLAKCAELEKSLDLGLAKVKKDILLFPKLNKVFDVAYRLLSASMFKLSEITGSIKLEEIANNLKSKTDVPEVDRPKVGLANSADKVKTRVDRGIDYFKYKHDPARKDEAKEPISVRPGKRKGRDEA